MKFSLLFLALPLFVMGQSFSDSTTSRYTDTTILPIPGFDSIATSADTLPKDSTPAIVLKPIYQGFLLGARWSFTSSDVFSDWMNQQKTYQESVASLLKMDEATKYVSVKWLMKPETQSFSFPLSLGYFHRIDSLKSITLEASYGFRRQRAVFSALSDTISISLFDNISKIDNHQTELLFAYQYRFNPEYFSVTGIEATGITLSAGAIPLSYFSVQTTSTNELFQRSESMLGFGGSWGVGLFTEKQMSERFLAQFFFNYHGTMTYGFSNKNNMFKLSSTDEVLREKSTMNENLFELGVHAIISKKSRADTTSH